MRSSSCRCMKRMMPWGSTNTRPKQAWSRISSNMLSRSVSTLESGPWPGPGAGVAAGSALVTGMRFHSQIHGEKIGMKNSFVVNSRPEIAVDYRKLRPELSITKTPCTKNGHLPWGKRPIILTFCQA
eukprot:TRINITY_DN109047_c0_g1_i1.p2 TRINITY_DN109047_c0_g1~~TRINITY_DN109047_c0_g1_i1.p2  ORF type:complete len:127 (+),score=7.48 TRINITY_DN109047_c0_g1_i1:1-381(+)